MILRNTEYGIKSDRFYGLRFYGFTILHFSITLTPGINFIKLSYSRISVNTGKSPVFTRKKYESSVYRFPYFRKNGRFSRIYVKYSRIYMKFSRIYVKFSRIYTKNSRIFVLRKYGNTELRNYGNTKAL